MSRHRPPIAGLALLGAVLLSAPASGAPPAREVAAGGVFAQDVAELLGAGARLAGADLVTRPEIGRVTLAPDGRLAYLAPSGAAGRTARIVLALTRAGGRTTRHELRLALTPAVPESGWGPGAHYTLATDARGRSIVEPGRRHRRIHVTPDGATRGDGASPATAVTPRRAMQIWSGLSRATPVSHWLLFERGHGYDIEGNLIPRANGESALHPLVIGAWGRGTRPEISGRIAARNGGGGPTRNLVIRDVVLESPVILTGEHRNLLLENVTFRGEVTAKGVNGLTIRNSAFLDIHRRDPAGPREKHGGEFGRISPARDRISGIYAQGVRGLLIETSLNDMSGWQPGYLDDPTRQPPTIYSHGYYLNYANRDVTFRENVTLRAASIGAQLRSGGVMVDNVFVDNNVGFNVLAGDASRGEGTGPYRGNRSFLRGNVVTEAGYRPYQGPPGARAWALEIIGVGSSVLDTVVAHKHDPNDLELAGDPDHIANRRAVRQAIFRGPTTGLTVERLRIHNWSSPAGNDRHPSQIAAEIAPQALPRDPDRITVQAFARSQLGRAASVAGLAAGLRTAWAGTDATPQVARRLGDFFRSGFGLDRPVRSEAGTALFLPDPRGGGLRWDNALNWTIADIPGRRPGDRAQLAGNRVMFSGTHRLAGLDLGAGGALEIGQGRLTVSPGPLRTRGGRIRVSRAGQLVLDSGEETALALSVEGGRFANDARLAGALDLAVMAGEVLLASPGGEVVIGRGDRLRILGSRALVGMDGRGGGQARLVIEDGGLLEIAPDAGGISTISEFRSGRHAAPAPEVSSRLELGPGAVLRVDLSGVALKRKTLFVLAELDSVAGRFDRVELTGAHARLTARAVYDHAGGRVGVVIEPGG